MLSKILVVLSLKIQCKYKEKYFLIYTSMRNLFNVKRRQDHFYNPNVDCVASEKYDGGYVWYPGMCFSSDSSCLDLH